MQSSPRCGARTRDGGACRAPAMCGKERGRMHGGASGVWSPQFATGTRGGMGCAQTNTSLIQCDT
ncbi:HGGxSTG domain-containing protein [Bradyrhizobium sp.]|uniref:HGGxSTG domain-containing protein n=1 Tax=Bradyrhizobium sp. TaxID=376 RepID=UPI002DDD31B8|nr:HGGxSTG domain-containing protein [Bradyrhizobium sp.]HEV2153690.1 HGGxSTG domain-containing protein [Bradyrhizobium sp.]